MFGPEIHIYNMDGNLHCLGVSLGYVIASGCPSSLVGETVFLELCLFFFNNISNDLFSFQCYIIIQFPKEITNNIIS